VDDVVLPFLTAGCATTEVALTSDGKPQAGAGTLQLVWLWPNRAEIVLDGKRYVGEWAEVQAEGGMPLDRGSLPPICRREAWADDRQSNTLTTAAGLSGFAGSALPHYLKPGTSPPAS
jgi:hypothetical protein